MTSQEQIGVSIGAFVPGGRHNDNENLPTNFLVQGEKHNFIILAGDGVRDAGSANAMGKAVKKWLNEAGVDGSIYSCYCMMKQASCDRLVKFRKTCDKQRL